MTLAHESIEQERALRMRLAHRLRAYRRQLRRQSRRRLARGLKAHKNRLDRRYRQWCVDACSAALEGVFNSTTVAWVEPLSRAIEAFYEVLPPTAAEASTVLCADDDETIAALKEALGHSHPTVRVSGSDTVRCSEAQIKLPLGSALLSLKAPVLSSISGLLRDLNGDGPKQSTVDRLKDV